VFDAPLMHIWCIVDARLVRPSDGLMDDNYRVILGSLPKICQRSKLEAYKEPIDQLRRQGHAYKEIAGTPLISRINCFF
jgi:hypothetical protein